MRTIYYDKNYLIHHGIKGMKWGVRRDRVSKNKVDVSIAKNSATRRVAEDYHNLSDAKFAAKYSTTKRRFAKRYNKTGGDTYSLGRKRQARALLVSNYINGTSWNKTASSIAKYDTASRAEQRMLDKGYKQAAYALRFGTDVSIANDFSRQVLKKYRR